LPYPYSNCIDFIEITNETRNSLLVNYILEKTKSSYRQKDCFDLCHTNFIINECDLDIPLSFTWEINPPQDKIKCVRENFLSFLNKDISAYCTKDCPLGIKYEI
jgi:hypothetical protein